MLKRVEDPMRRFEENPSVLASKDARRIVKLYNRVARTLVAFEYLWCAGVLWVFSVALSAVFG